MQYINESWFNWLRGGQQTPSEPSEDDELAQQFQNIDTSPQSWKSRKAVKMASPERVKHHSELSNTKYTTKQIAALWLKYKFGTTANPHNGQIERGPDLTKAATVQQYLVARPDFRTEIQKLKTRDPKWEFALGY